MYNYCMCMWIYIYIHIYICYIITYFQCKGPLFFWDGPWWRHRNVALHRIFQSILGDWSYGPNIRFETYSQNILFRKLSKRWRAHRHPRMEETYLRDLVVIQILAVQKKQKHERSSVQNPLGWLSARILLPNTFGMIQIQYWLLWDD